MTGWRDELSRAEKSCVVIGKQLRVHFLFSDGRELREEYNIDTGVCTRRHWKTQQLLSGEHWSTEVGAPELDLFGEVNEVGECSDQPLVSRNTTGRNLEWKISNLPYPIETYSVTVDSNDSCLIVRTTNKKYFKKLKIPDLERLNINLHQDQVAFTHKLNTLTITYKKPKELSDFEKSVYEEVKGLPMVLLD